MSRFKLSPLLVYQIERKKDQFRGGKEVVSGKKGARTIEFPDRLLFSYQKQFSQKSSRYKREVRGDIGRSRKTSIK